MRILYICHFFPPFNTIGAVRAGKTVRHLVESGHDVRVIAAAEPTLEQDDRSLPVEIPAEHVKYAKWLDVNGTPKRVLKAIKSIGGGRGNDANANDKGGDNTSGARRKNRSGAARTTGYASSLDVVPGPLRTLAHLYLTLTNLPDATIGWYPMACRAALRLAATWRPDVILASGNPSTVFMVASTVARRTGTPWVAEYRDLWADNANYLYQRWRLPIDRAIEHRVVAKAAGMVTVSEPLADRLRSRFGKPTIVVLNGYDRVDLPKRDAADDVLRIAYTGQVYAKYQNPRPVLEAIAKLGADAARVRVDFYLRSHLPVVQKMIDDAGVAASAFVHPPVPYAEARRLQASADLLLLMLWNDVNDTGILTGKMFEYVGVRRPILTVGPGDPYTGDFIASRGLGRVVYNAEDAARELRARLVEKDAGGVAAVPEQASVELSRKVQTQKLEAFLAEIVHARRQSESFAPFGHSK